MTTLILTGVDESETAAAAALKAAELASALGARLHVISAYGTFEAETVGEGSDQLLLSNEMDAARVAADAAAPLRSSYPDLEISTAAAEGKPGDALVREAQALDADLIVVGNKRVQGVTRVFGSIARDVAAHATCDLYVVNTHHKH